MYFWSLNKVNLKIDGDYIRTRDLDKSEEGYSDEPEYQRKKRKIKKIREIIETVYLWRLQVAGLKSQEQGAEVQIKEEEAVQFKPKEAAEIIGLPIKTIYDYMYSLK